MFRWSKKPAQINQFNKINSDSSTGKSRGSWPVQDEPDVSISKPWRYPPTDSRPGIGPHNPHIFISFKDYGESNENHDLLQNLLQQRRCGHLKCERRDGYYILFQDTPDGQRSAGDCYRSLLNKRINGYLLKMKLFDSGVSVKSQYQGVRARSPHRDGSTGLGAQTLHGRDVTSSPLTLSEHRRLVPASIASKSSYWEGRVPYHVSSQSLRSDQASSPSSISSKGPELPIMSSDYTNGIGSKKVRDSALSPSALSSPTLLSTINRASPQSEMPEPKRSAPSSVASLHSHAHRPYLKRRLSVGSDDMSISSGVSPSDVGSNPSTTAAPRCCCCKRADAPDHNPLVKCTTCRRAYHAACHNPAFSPSRERSISAWRCSLCIRKGRTNSQSRDRNEHQPSKLRQSNGLNTDQIPSPKQITLEIAQNAHSMGQSVSGRNSASLLANNTLSAPRTSVRVDQQSQIPSPADEPEVMTTMGNQTPAEHQRVPCSSEEVTIDPVAPQVTLGGPLHQTKSTSTVEKSDLSSLPLSKKSEISAQAERTDAHITIPPTIPVHASDHSTQISDASYLSERISETPVSQLSVGRPTKMGDSPSLEGLEGGESLIYSVLPSYILETDSDLSSVPDEESPGPAVALKLPRPKASFHEMITAALLASETGRLDGKEISAWIREQYEFFDKCFSTKLLYSNVHAVLSMNKKSGVYIKHEPPPGPRTRSKYSLSGTSRQREERNKAEPDRAEQQSRLSQARVLRGRLSVGSTPQETTSVDGDEAVDSMADPRRNTRYFVKNNASSAYRIACRKNNPQEWTTLPQLTEATVDENTYTVGDMVKILIDNSDDAFGKIFELRRVSDIITMVAILWYHSHGDMHKVLSNRKMREWPFGYSYILTNWIEVTNIKTLSRKADFTELRNVYSGPKIADCSTKPPSIRDAAAKEVVWVLDLLHTPQEGPNISASKSSPPVDKPGKQAGNDVCSEESEVDKEITPPRDKDVKSVLGKRARYSVPSPKNQTIHASESTILNPGKASTSMVMKPEENPFSVFTPNKRRKFIKSQPERSSFDDNSEVHVPIALVRKDTVFNATAIWEKVEHVPGLPRSEKPRVCDSTPLVKPSPRTEEDANTNRRDDGYDNEHETKIAQLEEKLKAKDQIIDSMRAWMARAKSDDRDTRMDSMRFPGNHSDPVGPSYLEPLVQRQAPQAHMGRPKLANEQDLSREGAKLKLPGKVFQEIEDARTANRLNVLANARTAAEARLQQQSTELISLKSSLATQDRNIKELKVLVDQQPWRPAFYDRKLTGWDDPANKDPLAQHRPPAPPLHAPYLRSEKKRHFGKYIARKAAFVKYGETPCSELRTLLNIPEGHVLCSHEGVLAYRDDSRAPDGTLLNPNAITPLSQAGT